MRKYLKKWKGKTKSMGNKWTPDQQKAINSTGGTVLVAAAAGSGKTSVLVQRVVNRIINPNSPIDLDKFLIVTFTNAAAQEMKDRILESLSKLSTSNVKSLNIERQRMLLKCSSIGTIHSFCNNLIKENFYKLNIPPNFRIAQENDLIQIKEKAMESTLEYFYDSRSTDFKEVMDLFSSEKNSENLSEIINTLNNFVNSLPFPEKWFEEKLKTYSPDYHKEKINPWTQTILDYSKDALEFCIYSLKSTVESISSSEIIKKAYLAALENDVSELEDILLNLPSRTWDETAQKINSFTFSRFKACKAEKEEALKLAVNSTRDFIKDVILKLKSYFSFSQKECSDSLEKISKIVKTLFDITSHFRKELLSLKLSKNMLDFSDLEHLTIKLLADESSQELKKSEVAEEISERYCEVMVDEYQDINEVQNTIFKLITKNEKNLFMVGDVKQSIYKFRQSRPEIFLDKKSRYQLYDESKDFYPAKIILGKNFRSTQKIIESINFIFKSLMSEKTGEISYTDEEKLFYGKSEPSFREANISLKLIDTSSIEEKDDDIIEAKEISKYISELISQGYEIHEKEGPRPANYGDFCILLRSANSHAHIYAHELNSQGIPSWSETNEKFLDTSEIATILSLLKIIDNPINDIPLISCMTSPIFGFSLDEISKVRESQKDKSFYFALKFYSENSDPSSSVHSFLKEIEHYRNISGTMSCSELIDYIYQKTDYPYVCLALPGGELKKSNLLLFKSYAKKFDDESSKGLKGFLSFIEGIKRKNSDLPSASLTSENENTVKIMSIHKSKGLEFPICILAGCSKEFVQNRESIVLHPDLGLGLKLKNPEGTLQFNNLIFKSISLKNKLEDISEELRILYVALTRAKQNLTMISSCNTQKIIKKCFLFQSINSTSPFLVQNCGSFLDWILLCICSSSMKKKLFEKLNLPCSLKPFNDYEILSWDIDFVNPIVMQDSNNSKASNSEINLDQIDEELLKKIKQNIEYKYPLENLAELPLKMAASKLSGSGEWREYFASSRPEFMSSYSSSSTARGSAMHKFMCFADLNAASNNLNFELDRICNCGLLLPEERALINKSSVINFLKSSICQRILKSPKVLREHRFSVNMPIGETPFHKEMKYQRYFENSIFVQGAMDCAFIENDQYVIVDYKTDKTNNILELFNKYSSQLKIYKYALEKIYGINVKEIGIYSFSLSTYYSVT